MVVMATYETGDRRRARRRARRARRWDAARPWVFMALLVTATACVLWLGYLAGLVA